MNPIRLTPLIKQFLVAIAIVFFVQLVIGAGALESWFGLVPDGFVNHGRIWQIFTYPFLHHDLSHFVLNALMLAFIGPELEIAFGKKKLIFFFFTCTTTAGIIYLGIQIWGRGAEGLGMPLVGASAGIYGILLAYGLLYRERVLLFMMLFPMKAKHFVVVLAAVEFLTTMFSSRNSLSSVAHLSGMAAAFAFLMIEKRMRATKSSGGGSGRKPKLIKRFDKKGNLKLIVNNPDDDRDSGPKTWH
jgi:membrane associated rhomboid family serine protease